MYLGFEFKFRNSAYGKKKTFLSGIILDPKFTVKDFSGHSAKVHSVAWSCDGKRLASGSLDKTACVFTLDKDRGTDCLFKGKCHVDECVFDSLKSIPKAFSV